jgi:hypothetical protein
MYILKLILNRGQLINNTVDFFFTHKIHNILIGILYLLDSVHSI